VDKIISETKSMAKDKHGNYVVQCVLEHCSKEAKVRVIDAIKEDLVSYATNKVSSNVVEKCFEVTTKNADMSDERAALYQLVLQEGDDGKKAPLEQLMQDTFGNYTVQSVIRHSRDEDREELESRVNAAEPELKNTATGRHILAAMRKAAGKEPEESESATTGKTGTQSKGSALHGTGSCKPCAWYWKSQGCKNAENCQHCHMCPEGEMKARKKHKRDPAKDEA